MVEQREPDSSVILPPTRNLNEQQTIDMFNRRVARLREDDGEFEDPKAPHYIPLNAPTEGQISGGWGST
jgi:hypothetical protein